MYISVETGGFPSVRQVTTWIAEKLVTMLVEQINDKKQQHMVKSDIIEPELIIREYSRSK